MDYAKIGARIRAARGIKGMTQERLSEAAGISVSYISEIENGHRALSIDVMERIADVLDVPPEWLLKSDVEKMSNSRTCCVAAIRWNSRSFLSP